MSQQKQQQSTSTTHKSTPLQNSYKHSKLVSEPEEAQLVIDEILFDYRNQYRPKYQQDEYEVHENETSIQKLPRLIINVRKL